MSGRANVLKAQDKKRAEAGEKRRPGEIDVATATAALMLKGEDGEYDIKDSELNDGERLKRSFFEQKDAFADLAVCVMRMHPEDAALVAKDRPTPNSIIAYNGCPVIMDFGLKKGTVSIHSWPELAAAMRNGGVFQ